MAARHTMTDVVGLFALMVALAVAVALASAARRPKDTFMVDALKLNDKGTRHLCQIASAQVQQVCDVDVNVAERLFFHDVSMHDTPYLGDNGWALDGKTGNNSDPYYMQKLTPGPNESSLRLTINDDANESFQIWGNACGTTGCGGEGAQQHKFRADGSASHSGSLVIGAPGTAADYGWVSGSYPSGGSLNIYNRHAGNWTHFPWVDGKNYIRNGTQVDGSFTVAKGNGDWNWVRVAGNHADNLYLGSDGTNRGVWADGDRDFSIYNQGNRALTVKTDGSVQTTGNTTRLTGDFHSTTCDGRMNLTSGETMYLLPKDGVVVGKEWGGNGKLSVEGTARVAGKFCIGSTCIRESDLKTLLHNVGDEAELAAQLEAIDAEEKATHLVEDQIDASQEY